MSKRLTTIGRPGIGGEFLAVYPTPGGRYSLRRFRQVSSAREERRRLGDFDAPASTMISDLLGAIEAIAKHGAGSQMPHGHINWDSHGLAGSDPSLRERFRALASYPA